MSWHGAPGWKNLVEIQHNLSINEAWLKNAYLKHCYWLICIIYFHNVAWLCFVFITNASSAADPPSCPRAQRTTAEWWEIYLYLWLAGWLTDWPLIDALSYGYWIECNWKMLGHERWTTCGSCKLLLFFKNNQKKKRERASVNWLMEGWMCEQH